MYETCIRNLFFFFFVEIDLMKHAFFVLYIYCILIYMYVSLKSHWGAYGCK